ncbi:hypothetical protein CIW83_18105 [Tissierella sp. P1]|uniref:DUF3883 domain-containing protein n=1 Tax=Tissierella sp. P1 TaxID=1280483 RepID=UPI000BA077B7|nr:DUF3883 domain-containing protein [Tissierella sp. P1]OZV10839.1 hypothetical protein CIW83_18105 [Tissierella sp. P1]
MLFSVGVLYSSHNLLDEINKDIINDISFLKSYKKYIVANSKDIFDVSLKCSWITISNMNIRLTKRGFEILQASSTVDKLRLQLIDLVCYFRPSWAMSIPYGRKEALHFMPIDVKQCFEEANLVDNYSEDTIEWWDKLSSIIKGFYDDELLKIGRIGEKLSIEYEFNRTGHLPKWMSIETNICGYDLLSCISRENRLSQLIEVKTCSNSSKEIHISNNEWNTAISSENYIFHIWFLNNKSEPKLIILKPDELQKNIPKNMGSGEWGSVKIYIGDEYNK